MKKPLKWTLVVVLSVVLLVAGIFIWATWKTSQGLQARLTFPPVHLETVAQKDLATGRRIVMIRNGCVDCHGEDLAGRKFIDEPPMGIVSGSNLTPASLGAWSDEQIAQAIRYGINREGRPLIIMPSHEYQNLSKEDLAAAVAYLRTVPAIDRPNEPITLGPVARLLYAFGKLPTLMPALMIADKPADFVTKPTEEATVEFGRYLVNSSCVGCHGPQLAGGPIPGGPPNWPPASNLRGLAKKQWTRESFIQTMRTGTNPSGHQLRPPMPVALTAQMSDVELEALWKYFETVEL